MGEAEARAVARLRTLLRTSTAWADEKWRRWADSLVASSTLTPSLLTALWHEVCDFDPVLAAWAAEPLAVPNGTVIVAGSGKETFKTFNVSTAASILAAAAGGHVVKGVSRSVSAVSGAADVLDALGVPTAPSPAAVPGQIDTEGIAFISYATFCPTYAGRYDGVFHQLSPFSFFMPVAVLAVRGGAFVYGLAHPDVLLATTTITQVRPDLATGCVVTTELADDDVMDERAPFGLTRSATLAAGEILPRFSDGGPPPRHWLRAVAHGRSHEDNAALVTRALEPEGCAERAGLVEDNAALILQSSRPDLTDADAFRAVHEARVCGAATDLLYRLRRRREAALV